METDAPLREKMGSCSMWQRSSAKAFQAARELRSAMMRENGGTGDLAVDIILEEEDFLSQKSAGSFRPGFLDTW